MDNRNTDLTGLHDQIADAEYRVDPIAVADAIVRRRWSVTVAPAAGAWSSAASRRRTRTRVSCIARGGARGGMRALAA